MLDLTLIQKIPQLPWQAREVIRELDGRPHLLVRIRIEGGYFAQRAPEPFMRIVSGHEEVRSWFAEISEDNSTLTAYFPTDLPAGGIIEYGYGDTVQGRLQQEFSTKALVRLDAKRLAPETVRVSQELIRAKEKGSPDGIR